MSEDQKSTSDPCGSQKAAASGAAPGKTLPPAAIRALEEAAARRNAQNAADSPDAARGGPRGKEPTRYGDWERKGRAVDF